MDGWYNETKVPTATLMTMQLEAEIGEKLDIAPI